MSLTRVPRHERLRIIVGYRAGVEIQVCWYQGAYYLRTPQAMSPRGRNWRPVTSVRGFIKQCAFELIRGNLIC